MAIGQPSASVRLEVTSADAYTTVIRNDAADGTALRVEATSTDPAFGGWGLQAVTSAPDGNAIWGYNSNVGVGGGWGVYGQSDTATGGGVFGEAQHIGVQGHSYAPGGHGGYFVAFGASGYGLSAFGGDRGAYLSGGTQGAFIEGSGIGTYSRALAANGFGVRAEGGTDGTGVLAIGETGVFVEGGTTGVFVRANSSGGAAISAVNDFDETIVAESGSHTAVRGEAYGSDSAAIGLWAVANSATGDPRALVAQVQSPDAFSIYSTGPAGSLNYFQQAVAVGTTTPDAGVLLHVAGDAAKPGGGSWSVASDARLKRDVEPLQGTLDRLLALRGVSYEYRDPKTIHELPGRQSGFIAQEVATVMPEWVQQGPDGYLRLSVRGFEALVVEALRDLRDEKDEDVSALLEENEELRRRLARLERRIDDLTRPAR